MEISIFTIIIALVIIVVVVKLLSEFALNAVRAVIYVFVGLLGVYLLVKYYPYLLTWVTSLF